MCRPAVSETPFHRTHWDIQSQHKYIYYSANFAPFSVIKIAKFCIFFGAIYPNGSRFELVREPGSGNFNFAENRELNCMPSQKNRDRTEPNFGSVLSVLVLCISSELNFGNTRCPCLYYRCLLLQGQLFSFWQLWQRCACCRPVEWEI